MPGESRGAPAGISRDFAPQLNKTVTTTEATIGPVVELETINLLTIALANTGSQTVNGKLQANEFTGDESDTRWIDLDTTTFSGIAAGAKKRAVFQPNAKYIRFRASTAAVTSTVDLAMTGV